MGKRFLGRRVVALIGAAGAIIAMGFAGAPPRAAAAGAVDWSKSTIQLPWSVTFSPRYLTGIDPVSIRAHLVDSNGLELTGDDAASATTIKLSTSSHAKCGAFTLQTDGAYVATCTDDVAEEASIEATSDTGINLLWGYGGGSNLMGTYGDLYFVAPPVMTVNGVQVKADHANATAVKVESGQKYAFSIATGCPNIYVDVESDTGLSDVSIANVNGLPQTDAEGVLTGTFTVSASAKQEDKLVLGFGPDQEPGIASFSFDTLAGGGLQIVQPSTLAISASAVSGSDYDFTATGTGFKPGEVVHGLVHSNPIDLGNKTADANGSVTFDWTMPKGSAGTHTIFMTGVTSGEVSQQFNVVEATDNSSSGNGDKSGDLSAPSTLAVSGAASPAPAVKNSAPAASGANVQTGGDSADGAGLISGVGLLAAGAAAATAAKRRRA